MKCSVCLQRKGKRNCIRYGGEICSECCGKMRSIRFCNSVCEYMQQRYERIDTSSLELTEVGRGKVIFFSDSLFIPDILECYYCDVEQININIIEPTRLSFSTRFVIRKDVARNVNLDEAYKSDSWKKSNSSARGIPFLQIYAIGLGKISNVHLDVDNLMQTVEIENNHVDTWLPGAYSKVENLTKKEISEIYRDIPKCDSALTYYGKHFFGNNSTLFANIQEDKEYNLKLEIIYETPQFEEQSIILPFGLFWPFKLVNYKKFCIDSLSSIELDASSNTMLMLPFEEKYVVSNAIPLLRENAILSSPKYIPYETKKLEETFHYDDYCILHNHFKIKLHNATIAKAIFADLPILTGVYDSVNKVYGDEYAPVSVIVCNNSPNIEKYKIEVEMMGISYRFVKEIFVEPYRVNRVKCAPKLIEDRVFHIRSNMEYDMNVKVVDACSQIIYEETSSFLFYPREVFIDILKNKTKDWKIDLRSFITRWITPTIPQIEEIIAGAGKEYGLGMRGASNHNNDDIQREMKCIYDYLSKKINYVARPLAFAEGDYHAQKVSLPSTTLHLNSGNCIDLSILLSSCFEALKLNTFIVLIPGHAFLKVELHEKEIVYLESTCMGREEYYEAVEKAREKYDKFFTVNGPKVEGAHEIEVKNARKANILPME